MPASLWVGSGDLHTFVAVSQLLLVLSVALRGTSVAQWTDTLRHRGALVAPTHMVPSYPGIPAAITLWWGCGLLWFFCFSAVGSSIALRQGLWWSGLAAQAPPVTFPATIDSRGRSQPWWGGHWGRGPNGPPSVPAFPWAGPDTTPRPHPRVWPGGIRDPTQSPRGLGECRPEPVPAPPAGGPPGHCWSVCCCPMGSVGRAF